VRKAVAQHFPYAVFFRVREGLLVILAVFHGRRDPTIWHHRA
jgi:plasmid stabilization system protein ParE